MLGSSQSIAGPNIVLNTIMAEELQQFADLLENTNDFEGTLQKLICDTLTNHKRIIFNGNGYSAEWTAEASKRGLSNLACTAKALPSYISEKNLALVTKHGIFTESEFFARYEIYLESYNKIMHIEAKTMVDMVLHQILPAAMRYSADISAGLISKRQALGNSNLGTADALLVLRLTEACDKLYSQVETLHSGIKGVPEESKSAADYYCNVVTPQMQAVRETADLLEKLTAKSYWPYPLYSDILFY